MMKYRESMTFQEKCRFFASGRAGVRQVCAGPDLHFVPRYRPTVGGRGVGPKDMPEFGYETRHAALNAAKDFKKSAAAALRA